MPQWMSGEISFLYPDKYSQRKRVVPLTCYLSLVFPVTARYTDSIDSFIAFCINLLLTCLRLLIWNYICTAIIKSFFICQTLILRTPILASVVLLCLRKGNQKQDVLMNGLLRVRNARLRISVSKKLWHEYFFFR